MRLWNVLRRLAAGQHVHVSIVGGSISAGSTLGIQHRHAKWLWHGKFFEWLNATWPHSDHRHFNGAVPASTPGYVTGCLSFHAPQTSHLVVVEYSVNSPDALQYERLVRRLLLYPQRPAVVLLHMYKFWPPHKGRGFDASTISDSDLAFRYRDAHIESAGNKMAEHYNLTSLSIRDVIFQKVRLNVTDGLRLTDVMVDRIHPNVRGHSIAAELLVNFVKSELGNVPAVGSDAPQESGHVFHEALGQEVHAVQAFRSERSASLLSLPQPSLQPLPLPLHPGNNQDDGYDAIVCVKGNGLLQHTLGMEGWEYVVEGTTANPKPGLVAMLPGKRLELCWIPHTRFIKAVSFKLGYLKTYGGVMGKAKMWCRGKCDCKPLTLDGSVPGKPRSRDKVP